MIATDEYVDGVGPNFLMKFPTPLESAFEDEGRSERIRHLSRGGIVGLLLYDLFLVNDWQLLPDVFGWACLLRLAVFTPLVAFTIVVPTRSRSVVLREGSWAAISVLSVVLVMILLDESASPYRVVYHYGVVLIMLFATAVQRLRLPYTFGSLLGILAVLAIGVLHSSAFDSRTRIADFVFFVTAATLMATVAYSLEREQRLGFLAIRKDRLMNERLERSSRVDPLTGLWNRRHLDEVMSVAWRRADPSSSMAVIFLDVDRFKVFNDTHGHIEGDLCLGRIGRCLDACVQERGGTAVRYGGDEFLLFLPGYDLDLAAEVAETARGAVRRLAIPFLAPDGGKPVAISLGVAAALASRSLPDGLIRAADEALYQAKSDGRDRVRTSTTWEAISVEAVP